MNNWKTTLSSCVLGTSKGSKKLSIELFTVQMEGGLIWFEKQKFVSSQWHTHSLSVVQQNLDTSKTHGLQELIFKLYKKIGSNEFVVKMKKKKKGGEHAWGEFAP